MAKNSGADDHAKVKVRVIQFELEGGNATVENSIRQLTTALTNRPIGPKLAAPKTPKELHAGNGAETIDEPEVEVLEPEVVDTETSGKPAGPKTKYKPRIPTYIPEQDMLGNGVSFKDFAAQKAPTKHTTRYLVAAAWLKEHGNSPTINQDKVFTCYRTASWPMNITDWDVNFRSQVKTDRFRRLGPGEYQITPIGEHDLA